MRAHGTYRRPLLFALRCAVLYGVPVRWGLAPPPQLQERPPLLLPLLPNLLATPTYSTCYSRHAPSLLVLDDLDKIAPTEGDEGAGAFNAQAARIAERLEDLLAQGGFERAKRAPVYV